ncbi:hypothetical protein WAI453_008666 [Rhynchosporium graminicola]
MNQVRGNLDGIALRGNKDRIRQRSFAPGYEYIYQEGLPHHRGSQATGVPFQIHLAPNTTFPTFLPLFESYTD